MGYSFSDDDDDDVLVIDEDDEEGWDDFEDDKEEQEEEDGWGDQNVGVVLSPAKPVKNVTVKTKGSSVWGSADAAREEYVPLPTQTEGSRRITFDDSGRAGRGGHAAVPPTSSSLRPISAPSALRKNPVIRLTATGSLGQSSSSARPSSAGPSLRLCSAIGGDYHHHHAAGCGLDDGDAVLARRRARGEDVKVFVINGPFQDVRRGLERRCESRLENLCISLAAIWLMFLPHFEHRAYISPRMTLQKCV